MRAVKNAGLVDRIDFRPSRERELAVRAEPLEPVEQQWALRLADDASLLQAPEFQALPAPRRALVQDAAFRLDRYRSAGEERDKDRAQRGFQLLQAINRNPPPALDVERPALPEDGHDSRTWQLGLGSREDRAYAEYGLRMAYHDLQDNLAGFPSGPRSKSSSSSCASTRKTTGNCSNWTSPPSAR